MPGDKKVKYKFIKAEDLIKETEGQTLEKEVKEDQGIKIENITKIESVPSEKKIIPEIPSEAPKVIPPQSIDLQRENEPVLVYDVEKDLSPREEKLDFVPQEEEIVDLSALSEAPSLKRSSPETPLSSPSPPDLQNISQNKLRDFSKEILSFSSSPIKEETSEKEKIPFSFKFKLPSFNFYYFVIPLVILMMGVGSFLLFNKLKKQTKKSDELLTQGSKEVVDFTQKGTSSQSLTENPLQGFLQTSSEIITLETSTESVSSLEETSTKEFLSQTSTDSSLKSFFDFLSTFSGKTSGSLEISTLTSESITTSSFFEESTSVISLSTETQTTSKPSTISKATTTKKSTKIKPENQKATTSITSSSVTSSSNLPTTSKALQSTTTPYQTSTVNNFEVEENKEILSLKEIEIFNNFFTYKISLKNLDLSNFNEELQKFLLKQEFNDSIYLIKFLYNENYISTDLVYNYFINHPEIKKFIEEYAFLMYYSYSRKYPVVIFKIKNVDKVKTINEKWEKSNMIKDLSSLFWQMDPGKPTQNNFISKKFKNYSYRMLNFSNNYQLIWALEKNYLIYTSSEAAIKKIFSSVKL